MSLYVKWEELVDQDRSQTEYDEFWKEYLEKEMKIYQHILENKGEVVSGRVDEVSKRFDMDPVTFAGFVSGINTSLKTPVDIDNLNEDTEVSFDVDYEALYFNMLEAKADWLYTLTEWDNILTQEKRKEIVRQYNSTRTIIKGNKIGRNDACPCGSGLKYKKCCGK
jgi:hypothetical protein